MIVSMVRVQGVLAGRYELRDVLGRGGMGVVYRATDRVLGRPVAVKVLPVDRAEDPSLVLRFEREALAAAALNHANVVAVFDSGRDHETRFIVMEYVDGANLAQRLRDRGPLTAGETAAIAAQIAGAMAAAHRAGLIHRDIKPANVMVDRTGRVKVLDFGIARALASTSLTQTATVLGSAPYLAPEVARGEPADERSDTYSLGCVLYEMLAGRPPFTGELPAAIVHQHTTAPPRPIRELTPDVPPALAGLIMRMLAKSPGDRPDDSEVVRALTSPLTPPTPPAARSETPVAAPSDTAAAARSRTAATGRSRAAARASVADAATPLTAPTRVLAGQIPAARGRRRTVLATLAVLAAAVVALALAGAFTSSARSHRSAASPARPAPRHTASTAPRNAATRPPTSTATSASVPTARAQTAPPAPPLHGKGHEKARGKGADGVKPPKPPKAGKPRKH
jgi:serine/threonine-protein kinase